MWQQQGCVEKKRTGPPTNMARSEEQDTKNRRLGQPLSPIPVSSQDQKLPLHMYAPSMNRHHMDMKPQPHLPNFRHTGWYQQWCLRYFPPLDVVTKQRLRKDGGEIGAATAAGPSVINVWQTVMCYLVFRVMSIRVDAWWARACRATTVACFETGL